MALGNQDAPRLLDRHEDIDAAWLTRVLRGAGHADADVLSFEARPIGAGNVSETLRVDLGFAAPTSAPTSVVCKFRSNDAISHAHGIGSGSYLRELESYRALRGRDDVCRIPAVLWVDGHAENINLVMEDLTATARAGSQVEGCGLDDARSVVTELAKLHRGFHPMGPAEAPAWGMTMAGAADYWSAAIDRGMAVIKRDVADRLSGLEVDTIAAAAASAADWYRLPMERGTLTHGDPRVDNILFGPSGAVLIDWQITGWRNPMHDIGYFLSGSVTVESRRLSEHDLLRLYADTFGPAYERRAIERDYRLQLLSGLMTTMAAYGLLASSPEVDRLLITLLRRNAAAVADWDSVEALSV